MQDRQGSVDNVKLIVEYQCVRVELHCSYTATVPAPTVANPPEGHRKALGSGVRAWSRGCQAAVDAIWYSAKPGIVDIRLKKNTLSTV